ncbi:glycine C-acetyltransferase [Natranaerobius thermophilus]|uniref:8-amino-7-ketopelargonate synthase n=1 Tax=Natranaerobius thermophilus (strain ATCC BAA-1301 / DSM 18059 / JW/NM-WN-LF) TaxID=457570 RepID=B2A4W8_NATTJ|nr:glycine C-acetyltransferase [Natranaerobius thermophilus]ACB83890.1 2-amino-3-ketobutyrate coenzyme A ligase [Natranaerobius thermophilus JW/NM-WN-LF]
MSSQEKLNFIQTELEELKEKGLYKDIKTLEGPQGAWVQIKGKKMLNFCSNNYLGFANHSQIVEAAKKAIDEYGVGPGAVRTIAGTMDIHHQLERKLAEFKGVEAALSVQSGFKANLSAIPALVGKGDTIISDELNHASIIDGSRLSRADIKVYSHNDVDSLESVLKENPPGKKLIITDGVFSMDGDIAPLPEIVEVAKKYDAMTMVDDAHGEGVLGRSGRGIVDHFNLHGEVDIEIGTFSKALGVMGGCIAGSAQLIEYIRQKSRPFTFSSALTVPDTAATLEAIKILSDSDELVTKLWDNADYFKKGIKELGFDTGESETPITPVMIGDAKAASEFSEKLFEENIFAQAIGFPLVPHGKARIRAMISAAHSKEDLDFALEKFSKVGKELNLI